MLFICTKVPLTFHHVVTFIYVQCFLHINIYFLSSIYRLLCNTFFYIFCSIKVYYFLFLSLWPEFYLVLSRQQPAIATVRCRRRESARRPARQETPAAGHRESWEIHLSLHQPGRRHTAALPHRRQVLLRLRNQTSSSSSSLSFCLPPPRLVPRLLWNFIFYIFYVSLPQSEVRWSSSCVCHNFLFFYFYFSIPLPPSLLFHCVPCVFLPAQCLLSRQLNSSRLFLILKDEAKIHLQMEPLLYVTVV